MRVKLGVLLMIGASLLFFAGLCAPRLLYKDHDAGLTSTGAAILKTRTSQQGLQIPAVWQQITDGTNISPFRELGDEYSVMNGVVISRAPFGIAYERAEILRNNVVHAEYQERMLLVAWGLFLMPELVLLGLAVFCLRAVLRMWWAKIEALVARWDF